MHIGKLDRRIDIYQNTATAVDSFGQRTETLTLAHTVWAQYMPSKGTEGQSAIQNIAKQEVIFLIRYIANLTEKDYLVNFDYTYYNIVSVELVGRKEYVKLHCVKRDNERY